MRYQSALMRFHAALLCAVCLLTNGAAQAGTATTDSAAATDILDIDGNGTFEALTDALLVMRYAFGLRGQTLIQGAIGQGATRTTAAQIESYLASLTSTLPANCTITQSPASSAVAPVSAGTQIRLTASCAGGVGPIGYAWNNGATGSVQTVAPQSTTTYTVTPTNANGTGTAFSTTVYIGSNIAPSNCIVTQSPNTSASPVAAGTNVSLSAGCAGGTAPTSCSWTNGIASTSCTVNVVAPATTTTYSVTASNTAGSAFAVSTTVNVIAQGPVAQNFCTSGIDNIYADTWPPNGQWKYPTNGFKDQRIAFRIDVPPASNPPANINKLGFFRMAELPGSAVIVRGFTLSKNACDFQTGNYIANGMDSGDTAPYVSFTIDNPNYQAAGASINLNSGQTYYLNVRNRINTSNTCPYASCDISLDLASPSR